MDFRLILAHPVIIWHEPILTLNRERMVLRYEDVVLRLDAVVLLRLHHIKEKGPSTALGYSVNESCWLNLVFLFPVESVSVMQTVLS